MWNELQQARHDRDTCNTARNALTGQLAGVTSQLNTQITHYNTLKQQYKYVKKLLKAEIQKVKNCNNANDSLTQSFDLFKQHNYVTSSEKFSTMEGLTTQESTGVNIELKNNDRTVYNAIHDQNNKLTTEIERYRNEYSTDEQKVNYEQQDIYIMLKAMNILKWIYFFLFLILFYFIYYTNNYSTYFKIGIIIILAIYPFVIYPLEKKGYDLLNYLWSFIQPK
jgi:hypothetical protein